MDVSAFTLNASVNSVFLTMDMAIAEGRAVHVAISLKKDGMETVRLYGTGNVVRTETLPTGRFALAIAFDKPLTPLARHRYPEKTPLSLTFHCAAELRDIIPPGRRLFYCLDFRQLF